MSDIAPRRFFRAVSVLAVSCLLVAGCAGMPLPPPNGSIAQAPDGTETAIALPADSAEIAGREVVSWPQRQPAFGLADIFGGVQDFGPADKTADSVFDVVTVHWGTDRKVKAATGTSTIETGMLLKAEAGDTVSRVPVAIELPGADRGYQLNYGRSHVTVPRIARTKGSLQRPYRLTFLNWRLYSEAEDPRKHFTVGTVEMLDRQAFVQSSEELMKGSSRFPDEAFVFVHGFNVSFEDALYRTAQIAYDLEFDGVPYMYSWPSRGQNAGYFYDRDSADRARGYFLEFLRTIAQNTSAKRIHIIAHSLGGRPLVEALQQASIMPGGLKALRIGEVIMAAPDIDRDVFTEIADVVAKAGKGATLFVADNDRALLASRTLALGQPRAGEVPAQGPVVVKGIDTIDISQAGTDALLSFNHATYADSSHLLTDLRLLLKNAVRPPDRRFPVYLPRSSASGNYWQYVKN